MTEHPESRARWTDIFVRRPVVSVVLSLAMLLIGVRAATTLPVIQYPVIESASLEINTFYSGSSAETVRGFITEPIERVASSIPGVNYVESTTTAGRSLVKVWLKLNEDSTDALAELNTRLSQIRFELPEGAEDPAIEIVRADSPYASFYLAMSIPEGETSSSITDLMQRDVLPRLTSLPNVQNAINSGIRPAMRIWVDTARMAALDVSTGDIQNALRQNNVISTLGRSQNSVQRINLVTNTEAKTPEDFANILLRADGNVDIRLGDIAQVIAGSEEQTQLSRHTMLDVVFIGIYPAPGANEIAVADALYAEVDAINETLREDLEFFIAFDVTRYMRTSLKEIFITLGETIFLVGFVVVALMGSLRTAIVPLLTIPISLLGAMAAMSLMGFSLNLLTILAIVLSVGLVVDDAIVVVENVARNLRQGMTRREAALRSSRRLLAPIIAMTLTLAVVYAPIGLLSGLTGVLFKEFAFTLAIAVLISGLVALTLSPIMSAWVCPSHGEETRTTRWVNRRFDITANRYARIVDFSIRFRWQLIFTGIFFSLLTGPLYLLSLKELAPVEDQSGVTVIADAAPEAAIEDTYQGMNQAVKTMGSFEGATEIWQMIMPSASYGGQDFTDPGDRSQSIQDMLFSMYGALQEIPSLSVFPVADSDLPSPGQFDVEVAIASSDDAQTMLPYAQALVRAAKESGLFLFADTDLRVDLVEARINFNKQRLADLNMSLDDVARQVGLLNSEAYITRYDDRGRAYRVIPKVAQSERDSPDAILDFPIRTLTGELIPLGAIATLERTTSPRALTRFQQKNAFKIFGGVIPGTTKEQGLSFIEKKAAEILPSNYILDYTGESRELRSEGNTLLGVLLAAMALVFFVLAIQFNSFRDPLIILLGSIPLALFAALSITFVNLTTVNIYSQVGLITLAGLVAKNAILIVEFANQAQREGLDKIAAIRAASVGRLRPVLMTTGATVLGHLPLTLVTGAGAEARNSIGFILVVGMLIGTFFTLVLLPAIYAVLASDHRYDEEGAKSGQPEPMIEGSANLS
ncbi:efflux RND transporter permease subunit [Luminiphilus sp. nBUS_07]|uniref:efflux RND transporter permease subunit n=1 Tax=Luminiphilus sp. nBUS_07 TaxID=3395314 RepID=UPI003EBFDD97